MKTLGTRPSPRSAAQLAYGFAAGFVSTLTFHQLVLLVIWSLGIAPFAPFSMAATKPFGIPAVVSLALWGGIWGVVFSLVSGAFPHGVAYWLAAFLFGAVLPSVVALMVVLPLKGRPMGGGWHMPLLLTAFLINGAWGLGTGIFYRSFPPRPGR
ncbi:MAG: hypothetical protein LLG06_12765 [Desulfobacteraceae bacterium]|nr:hypothetical protein [Desulfobacteraceae bacterium]